jgi:hypothetical protein
VAKKATYICTCSSVDGDNPKVINNGPTEGIEKGCTLSIKFTDKNTETTTGLKFEIGDT